MYRMYIQMYVRTDVMCLRNVTYVRTYVRRYVRTWISPRNIIRMQHLKGTAAILLWRTRHAEAKKQAKILKTLRSASFFKPPPCHFYGDNKTSKKKSFKMLRSASFSHAPFMQNSWMIWSGPPFCSVLCPFCFVFSCTALVLVIRSFVLFRFCWQCGHCDINSIFSSCFFQHIIHGILRKSSP